MQAQIRKVEEKLKPYLYDGCCNSYWGTIEQKTNVKREQIALGIKISSLLFLLNY